MRALPPLGTRSASRRASVPTGKRIHPERLRQLQALNASYGTLQRRAEGLIKAHRLGPLEVAQLEADVNEINTRKGAVGFIAIAEAGFDPNLCDYTIDEQTGEIIRLDQVN